VGPDSNIINDGNKTGVFTHLSVILQTRVNVRNLGSFAHNGIKRAHQFSGNSTCVMTAMQ